MIPVHATAKQAASELADDLASKIEQGGPARAMIFGPAGIGKTTLVGHVHEAWERRGWAAAFKICTPEQPNNAWSSGNVPASSDWLVQFHFLMRRSQSAPQLVAIDDLQVADASTFRLLMELAQRGREGIALLLSYRDDVPFVLPAEFASLALVVPDAALLPVPPLGWSETRSLLSGLISPGPEPGVELTDRIHGLTGGNPLFIEHAARALRTGHDPFEDDAGLLGLLARRISGLGADAEELLSTAAAVGDRFDVSLVASVEERSEANVWRLMRAAVHAGILQETDSVGELSFVHPAIREAASHFRLRHERVVLHQELLRRLESDEDADPFVLARHAELASDWVRYRQYSEAVGESAYEQEDFKRAADHLDRAVATAGIHEHQANDGLLRKAAITWVAAGRGARAAELWDELAERRSAGADLEDELQSRAQAVRAEPSEVRLERLSEAILRGRANGPSAGLAVALAAAVHATAGGRSVGGRSVLEASEEALSMARYIAQDEPLAGALLAHGHIVANAVDFEAGLALLRECLDLAERSSSRREEHAASINLVLLWTKSGSWGKAKALAESAAAAAHSRGAFRLAGQFYAKLAEIYRLTGDWEAAASFAAEGTLMTDRDDLQSFHVSHVARAALAADQGKWEEVEAEAQRILNEDKSALGTWFPGGNIFYLRARSQLATGRIGDAWASAKRVYDLWLRTSDAYYGPRFLEPYVELLCSAAQLGEAAQVVSELSRRQRWLPLEIRRTAEPWVASLTARLALAEGDLDRAVALETGCQDTWLGLRELYPAARSQLRLAETLLKRSGRGDRQRSKLLLAAAHGTLESLGAPEAATALRLRKREKWARATIVSDADGLTTREREIAELVGTGRSNHEIAALLTLSGRTVENHIARIYSKTGVNSRVQLANLLLPRRSSRAFAPSEYLSRNALSRRPPAVSP